MISLPRFQSIAIFACLLVAGSLWKESTAQQSSPSSDQKETTVPVEPDMHEFMEYVFQPTFKHLKSAMAAAPSDNQGWKAIKADSLILAEGGNLLLIRQPQADTAEWTKHSVQVRDIGGQLYRAAKAKDFTASRRHYETMIQHCNACHRQYADGEHLQTP